MTQNGSKDDSNIASNHFIREGVHDFAKNYTSPFTQFPRSEDAPVKAEVANWPAPGSVAQVKSKSKDFVLKAYADNFPRSDTAPTAAMVNNWDYPQFAQKPALTTHDWDPLSKEYGVTESFPRSSTEPKTAEVANWPFPQFT